MRKNMKTRVGVFAVALACLLGVQTASAGIVAELDWDASSGLLGVTANGTGFALTTDLTSTTGIDGSTGVLTSGDISLDPQLQFGATSLSSVALPAGFVSWDSLEFRFRQISGNPDLTAPIDNTGVDPVVFDPNGTLLITSVAGVTQGTTANAPGSPLTSAEDPEGAGWTIWTFDLSGVASTDNVGLTRFDPIGNNPGRNFEVDFVRLNAVAVPEPSSLALVGVCGFTMLGRRRRSRS
jgi:hypothetical protein